MSTDLEQLYQQVILDHAKQRQGYESPLAERAGIRTADSHQVNPVCGDEVTVQVALDADDRVSLHWRGNGCSISMASASVLAEMAEGRAVREFDTVEAAFYEMMHSRGKGEPDEELLEDASAFAGVSKFPARVKCALLAWMAYKAATVEALAATAPTLEEAP